jgi:hypothetical protein
MAQTEQKETPIELSLLEDYFSDSEDESSEARKKAERARDYYDNNQLDSKIKKALSERKQPAVVFNRIAPKIDFLLGTERQSRTDPKAYPRTPAHEDAANAVTDGIRFVLDKETFDVKASDVFENMLIEGSGGVSVEAEAHGKTIEVVIKRFRWDRWFADPHSLARDYSDARYTGVISWKDLDEAAARWPHAANDLQAGIDASPASDTYEDKPIRWYNKTRRRVMCVDMYFIHKGKWHHAIFGKGVWLDPPKVSTYLDGDGLPENPQIGVSAKVKRDGQRYGAVEALMDIQDEINKRRSKALHLLNTKQTFSKEGQITDIDSFKKEANKPDGHVEFPNQGEFGKDFGVLPNEQLVGPQFSMYQDAMTQMDNVQANAALSGKTEGDLSGRAIQSLQQGGMIELTPLFDAHAQWKKRVYEAVWNRIKQFWREERWIRVTDDEENLKFVGLNQPQTIAETQIAEKMGVTVKEVRQQFADELQAIYQQQPELKETARLENNVAEIDVDIIIEEVPDTVNLQSEQFDLLVKMYQANPNGIDWEDVVAVSTLRNKDKILNKELEPEEEEALEAAQAEEQRVKELALAKEASEIKVNEAKAAKDFAEAQAQDLENDLTESGLGALLEQANV